MARRKKQLRVNTFVDTKISEQMFNGITIGTVVDTNDPQQMGRVRAMCPALGDLPETTIGNLPWCSYSTPFGGTSSISSRGPTDDENTSSGPVSYGMWAIPKVGAKVLVMCIDGNSTYRVWVGCLHDQFQAHTLPHGRFTVNDSDILDSPGKPEGPLTTEESPIQPLYNNLQTAFGKDRQDNYEWRTRGADFSAAAVDKLIVEEDSLSFMADDKDIEFEGTNYRQGYEKSRQFPDLTSDVEGGGYYDSQTYAIVSPGFHAFSMDDRKENCRMRLRTTAGNQIILDDTNERIFISTANGKSWIEMDQQGNIDIHSDGRVSMHATKDINFTTDKSFRVKAKEGIHLQSDTDVRIQAETDVNVRSTGNVRLHSNNNTHISSTKDIYVLGASVHHKSSGTLHIEASSDVNILASGNIINTGAQFHMNGPSAAPATSASSSDNLYAYSPSRVPFNLKPDTDEMWGRTCQDPEQTDKDDASNALLNYYSRSTQELDYTDEEIGKQELGEFVDRGPYWRR